MKALILAAGMGSRLRPYTDHVPKPLFSVSNRPLLDITITKLIDAGCQAIIINTHHLSAQIEAFLKRQSYTIPIQTRYEPKILGTGGAIHNVRDFWNDQPFMVINADIVTTIDFKPVYDFHCQHQYPATIVLADDPEFNSVVCDADGFVIGFRHFSDSRHRSNPPALTFTGIQVLNPEIMDFIPAAVPSSSIDAYTRMIEKGKKIKAYIAKKDYWKDIGTAERYKSAVFETTAPRVFQRAFPDLPIGRICREHLKGDGSDRQWYRLKMGQKSIILVDHGIKATDGFGETNAFVRIGRHLFERGVSVPQIYDGDTFAGYVFLEDLGDLDLQTAVQQTDNFDTVMRTYQSVIHLLTNFSSCGAEQFNTSWSYQTPFYSEELILEKECRYFVKAFLNTYLDLKINYEDVKTEFEFLAENALKYAVQGLMSRNIMIKNEKIYAIDFQGARLGPIQYDLASLLIDPYVDLPPDIQKQLFIYCVEKLKERMNIKSENFSHCYRFCCLTRNLQILGAFGYLTCVKGKVQFETFIPPAVRTLQHNLQKVGQKKLPVLNALMDVINQHDHIQNPE